MQNYVQASVPSSYHQQANIDNLQPLTNDSNFGLKQETTPPPPLVESSITFQHFSTQQNSNMHQTSPPLPQVMCTYNDQCSNMNIHGPSCSNQTISNNYSKAPLFEHNQRQESGMVAQSPLPGCPSNNSGQQTMSVPNTGSALNTFINQSTMSIEQNQQNSSMQMALENSNMLANRTDPSLMNLDAQSQQQQSLMIALNTAPSMQNQMPPNSVFSTGSANSIPQQSDTSLTSLMQSISTDQLMFKTVSTSPPSSQTQQQTANNFIQAPVPLNNSSQMIDTQTQFNVTLPDSCQSMSSVITKSSASYGQLVNRDVAMGVEASQTQSNNISQATNHEMPMSVSNPIPVLEQTPMMVMQQSTEKMSVLNSATNQEMPMNVSSSMQHIMTMSQQTNSMSQEISMTAPADIPTNQINQTSSISQPVNMLMANGPAFLDQYSCSRLPSDSDTTMHQSSVPSLEPIPCQQSALNSTIMNNSSAITFLSSDCTNQALCTQSQDPNRTNNQESLASMMQQLQNAIDHAEASMMNSSNGNAQTQSSSMTHMANTSPGQGNTPPSPMLSVTSSSSPPGPLQAPMHLNTIPMEITPLNTQSNSSVGFAQNPVQITQQYEIAQPGTTLGMNGHRQQPLIQCPDATMLATSAQNTESPAPGNMGPSPALPQVVSTISQMSDAELISLINPATFQGQMNF